MRPPQLSPPQSQLTAPCLDSMGRSPLDLLLEPLLVVQMVHRAGHLDVFGLAMRLGLGSRLVPLVAACTLTVAVLLAALRSRAQTDLMGWMAPLRHQSAK